MGKTIIQTIGPLYGEVVNGTVFGRPNGSVYVPAENTITATLAVARRFVRLAGADIVVCNSTGQIEWNNPAGMVNVVAQSQDLANYIQIELAEDSDFTQPIGNRQRTAGLFNVTDTYVALDPKFTIVADTTYYLRAQLISGSGVPVATSDTIEVVGVVVE